MDKGFLRILKEFNDDRMEIRKKPYNFYQHCDEEEKELHQLYLQYKIFKWTKWLVFATWGLAIATIILAIVK